MSFPRTREPRVLVAGAGLGLVLVVVLASAAIRIGADAFSPQVIQALRGAHRTAASLEALVILALLWSAWRSRLVLAAAALTLLLSVVGVLAGRNPPAAAALVNGLGGLALAACFAMLLKARALKQGEAGPGNAVRGNVVLTPIHFFPLLALQVLLGAVASVVVREVVSFTLLVHALLGIALAVFIARAALHMDRPLLRFGLVLLALVVPATGFGAALFGLPWGGALAHAAAVALFVSAASFAFAHAKAA
jgi:hypothetical protein